MADRCVGCNVKLDEKLRVWASYCSACYDKGIMLWNEEKKKNKIIRYNENQGLGKGTSEQ